MFSHNLRSLVVLFLSLVLPIYVIAADKSKTNRPRSAFV